MLTLGKQVGDRKTNPLATLTLSPVTGLVRVVGHNNPAPALVHNTHIIYFTNLLLHYLKPVWLVNNDHYSIQRLMLESLRLRILPNVLSGAFESVDMMIWYSFLYFFNIIMPIKSLTNLLSSFQIVERGGEVEVGRHDDRHIGVPLGPVHRPRPGDHRRVRVRWRQFVVEAIRTIAH